MATDALLTVTVVYSAAPRSVSERDLQLPAGSTVADAIRASNLLSTMAPLRVDTLRAGLWGRKVPFTAVLRDRDRVELYRPLLVDPKVARRERFVRQGAKSAGLFAKRRAGAKAGY